MPWRSTLSASQTTDDLKLDHGIGSSESGARTAESGAVHLATALGAEVELEAWRCGDLRVETDDHDDGVAE